MPCDRAFQKSEILFNFCVNVDGCVRVAEAIGATKLTMCGGRTSLTSDLIGLLSWGTVFLHELSPIISPPKTNPLKCWCQESKPYVKYYLFDEHHVFHVSRFTDRCALYNMIE